MPDWYEIACQQNHEREESLATSPLSRFWSSRLHGASKNDLDDMLTIRDAVRGVLRAHGLPKACSVDLATISQIGAGAAGFKDAPDDFQQPYILLDKSVYHSGEREHLLDIYCGIGLHEAQHILSTRDFYLRMHARRKTPFLITLFENLWEDERIEALVCAQSPGFSPYLQAMKQHLLIRAESGRAINDFDKLSSDMDRIHALMFAFVRFPHYIPASIREWTAANGECVFETLRSLFPHPPRDESDVAEFAARIKDLWDRLRNLYPKTADPASIAKATGGVVTKDVGNRIVRQLMADAEDRARTPKKSDPKSVADRLLEEALQIDHAARDPITPPQLRDELAGAAEELIQRAIAAEQPGGAKCQERRFGLQDLQRIQQTLSKIQEALTKDESEQLSQLNQENKTFAENWSWGQERRTEVETCQADQDAIRLRYDEAYQIVSDHVRALREVFRIPANERSTIERDLTRGRPDPRRLAKARITGRVFQRVVQQQRSGRLAICLLLDESGSMEEGYPIKKSDVALQIAVLMAESLKNAPGVELEIYSHTSGSDQKNCLVRHLYGKHNRDRYAIGCYASDTMANNYDHQAISTVAKLFRESTNYRNRWLIVVSDGFPNGAQYQGQRAVKATAEVVAQVRKQGIHVLNIAIDDVKSEVIFGKDHILKFTDLGALVPNIRKLLVRLFRKS